MSKILDFLFPVRVAWRNADAAIKLASDWKTASEEWEKLYYRAAKSRDEAIELLENL